MNLEEEVQKQPLEFSVDMKWSLWTQYPEDFIERGYKTEIDAMKAAFTGEGPEVNIKTAPRKEIRFGTVGIYEGGAHVTFSFEWDEPSEQACRVEDLPELELTEAELAKVTDEIEEWCSEIDWWVELEVGAKTFEELMKGIDEVETRLLEQEEQYSEAFEAFLKTLRTEVQAAREYNKERQAAGDEHPWEVFKKIQRGEREE